ncbi:MAG: glycosyltransferase [Bacillota bacterium]|nr:glycosyltransferase [Bacillota bacterium]
MLAEEKHFAKKSVYEIKQNYNIPLQGHCVLLASGSIGGKLLVQIVKTIIKECQLPLNLIVACGKDQRSLKEVSSLENKNTNIHLIPIGYTEKFEEILEVSDCIIGRPSAGVFIESLIHEVPMLTFEKTPANDKGTLSIIRKYKIGKVCEGRTQIVQAVNSVLKDKEYYKNNISLLLNKYGASFQEKKKFLQQLILGV